MIFVLFETILSIGRLSWIVFVLSIGAKYLNSNNNVLAYSNEAVLPFLYIPSNNNLVRRLVCDTLEHWNSTEVSDNIDSLLFIYHGAL